jgi:dienelactone hydrolase
MKTESIEYQDGAVTLQGYLAYDDTQSGRRPGILVMPGGFGLGTNATMAMASKSAICRRS